ncbi:hypothetical protein REPUB_Repub20aG0020500 [Reevesia pubescens]
MALALALPRFIVLKSDKSNNNNDYLGYIHEDGKYEGYLKFSETQAVSPYAKFEVEIAGKDGLVHIRSCQNNKYWIRTKNLSITRNSAEQYWITATADKPEEDQSKKSCTLFKPIFVDPATKTVRIMHVQSGCYLWLWQLSNPTFSRFVLANYNVHDGNSCDIFTIIDWESLLILPRYVAFKGDNDHYLCVRWIQDHPYLQFASDDIGHPDVIMEIFATNDGNVLIKPTSSNKFWRACPQWIWVDSDNTSNNKKDTLFCPFKVDNQTIALLNLSSNNFCKRFTNGVSNCLKANIPTVTKEAQLKVVEPVLSREIYNVKYNFGNSRVYNEKALVVAKNSASNYSHKENTFDVKLSCAVIKTSTWKSNFSLKLGAKTTFEVGVPRITDGKVELSGEIQSGIEWGETKTTHTVLEVVHKVSVPSMSKVTVSLIATIGKCDVPFTFMQKDTLYNGTTVPPEVQGGTYIGSNYYNIHFKTDDEKLEAIEEKLPS